MYKPNDDPKVELRNYFEKYFVSYPDGYEVMCSGQELLMDYYQMDASKAWFTSREVSLEVSREVLVDAIKTADLDDNKSLENLQKALETYTELREF